MPKVSIQIVVWNNRKFLKECLDSVFNQTYQNFSVLIIDNASDDGSVEFVKENYPKAYVLRNVKNLGFSRAHNQGITMSQANFILVMNPDVILEPDFLEKLIKKAEEDENIGSLGGKMLKIKLGDPELDEKIKTKIIDSAGLTMFRTRRVIDRGEGEEDRGQYARKNEVFGISGACVLYRRKMLEDIKLPIIRNSYIRNKFVISKEKERSDWEYFDEDFFAYKEDIDLAWRARLRGWRAVYVPSARVYHFRGGAPISRRFSQFPWVNFLSYRNHLWMLVKNSFRLNFLAHFWFIFWYQLAKEFYLLFRQPKVLITGGWSFWQGYGKILRKRKYIFKNVKVGRQEIKKWFQ